MMFTKEFNARTAELEPRRANSHPVITYYQDKSFTMDLKNAAGVLVSEACRGSEARGQAQPRTRLAHAGPHRARQRDHQADP